MLDETSVMLKNNEDVKAFLKIISQAKMQVNFTDYVDLISHVDNLERQLNMAMKQLQDMNKKLSAVNVKENPDRDAYLKVTQRLERKTTGIKNQLQVIKENVITGAKRSVENFKQKGSFALNKVVDFLGIKDSLNAMKKSMNDSIDSANKSIARIESVSNEYHEIGSHTRAMGRALLGKEQIDDKKPKGKLAETAQKPFKGAVHTLTGINKKLDSAIGIVERLEMAVRANQVKAEKKPSVVVNLKDFKKTVPKAKSNPTQIKNKDSSL